ncbi:TPA: hypothetical protein ACX6QF_003633 [Photobacterium damselae]
MIKNLFVLLFLTIVLVSCSSCSSIGRVAYYSAIKSMDNPNNYADTILIEGSKPKELSLEGYVALNFCDDYQGQRSYRYKSQDFGDKYQIELPVIENENDSCRQINYFGLDGFWKNGLHAAIIYSVGVKYNSKDNVDYSNAAVDVYCFKDNMGKISRGCEVAHNSEYQQKEISVDKLKNIKSININILKGKHWDQVSSWAIEKK